MQRSSSLARRAPTRAPKAKFTIYTEGKNTEPDYFHALQGTLTGSLIELVLVGDAGAPLTIAEKACKHVRRQRGLRRSSYEEYDEIWVVFDRDDHPNIPDAISRCRAVKIGVAFSDPCFEVWLILHLQDFDRPDDRHQVQAELQNVLKGYDARKRKTADFTSMMSLVSAAEIRAEKQLNRRNEEGRAPSRPFTTVFELTRKIRSSDNKFRAT